MEIQCRSIGKVRAGKSFAIELEADLAPGLLGLKGFSHVLVIWYANQAPPWDNQHVQLDKPYRLAPEKLGVFATRSPYRPNSLCVSVAAVSSVDVAKGLIKLWWIDAADGTPVLDVKPYQPCTDTVGKVKLPEWCAHWPVCYEDSARFPWDKEFLF